MNIGVVNTQYTKFISRSRYYSRYEANKHHEISNVYGVDHFAFPMNDKTMDGYTSHTKSKQSRRGTVRKMADDNMRAG